MAIAFTPIEVTASAEATRDLLGWSRLILGIF